LVTLNSQCDSSNLTFDAASRITQLADPANAALQNGYQYDSLDRLTQVQKGNPVASTLQYTYDAVGNRLTSQVDAAATTSTYDVTSNRLQMLAGSVDAGYMAGAASVTFIYNNANRLTQMQVGSAAVATYAVNALGQRLLKTAGGVTTRFVYDEAGHLIGEYDAAGSLLQETVWLEDLPIATLRPTGTGTPTPIAVYYVHPDHLGTPRAITRPSDNLFMWRWDNTDPFGNSLPNENPANQGVFTYALRFPGQYYDAETGTHYNYFRDYDPSIGRYVQSDPIGIWDDISSYSYVTGNPLSNFDIYGLAKSGPTVKVPGTNATVRIDPPAPTHGDAQTHAHVCQKGCPEVVVNKDGTGSHKSNPDDIKNKKIREYLKKKGFKIREPGIAMFIGDIWDASSALANYCLLPSEDQKCVDVGLSPGCGLFGGT
jgi:RHS repeat-associated protein